MNLMSKIDMNLTKLFKAGLVVLAMYIVALAWLLTAIEMLPDEERCYEYAAGVQQVCP